MIAISVLFVGRDHINEFFGSTLNNAVTVIAIGLSIWFPIYNYRNLPVLDFRAYAPGLSICEGMKPGPNYKPAVYESRFIYKNIQTGDTTEFTDKNYPWQDTLHWKFHRALGSVTVAPAVDEAKITDFSISDQDGNNVTDSLLHQKGYHFFLVCYDLNKTEQDEKLMAQINDFYTLCEKNKINFIALTSSSSDQISQFKHKNNAMYEFYSVDGVVLKTMIRSNPGLMLLDECKVVANWHYHNFPVFSEVKSNYMK
jgi:peroxiredoxin